MRQRHPALRFLLIHPAEDHLREDEIRPGRVGFAFVGEALRLTTEAESSQSSFADQPTLPMKDLW